MHCTNSLLEYSKVVMELIIFVLVSFEVMTLYLHSYCESAFILESNVEESCTGESFQPKCSSSRDVILMLSAVYGRMKVGKCITNEEVAGFGHDPKYFGCSSDVLKEMHKKCSLKSTCEVKIPDADMDKSKPCFPGLKLYLQSEYTCINVVDQDQNCRIQASTIPKYLTTTGMFNNSRCGSAVNPWIIEVTKGQKIKFTSDALITSKSEISMNVCNQEIGIIMERTYKPGRNITICSNGLMMSSFYNDISENLGRQQDTFTSSSGLVELIFKKSGGNNLKHDKEEAMTLLKIEADGCTDVIPPEDSWLKRTNDEIVVGCYVSKQTWYLRCEDRKWIGVIGNCSHGYNEVNVKSVGKGVEESSKVTKEHQIIMFAAICGLGLVICMVIVCVGFICMKKFSANQKNLSVYNGIYNGHYSMNGQLQQDIQDRKIPFPTIRHDVVDDSFAAGEKTDENKYFILEDRNKPN